MPVENSSWNRRRMSRLATLAIWDWVLEHPFLAWREKTSWKNHQKVSLRVSVFWIGRFYHPWQNNLAQFGIAQVTRQAGCGVSLWYGRVCFLAVVLAQEEQRCFHPTGFAKFSVSGRLQVFQLTYCAQVHFEQSCIRAQLLLALFLPSLALLSLYQLFCGLLSCCDLSVLLQSRLWYSQHLGKWGKLSVRYQHS